MVYDPARLGSYGRPALVAAVLSGHHDVIPVLVQREADVNHSIWTVSSKQVPSDMPSNNLRQINTSNHLWWPQVE